MASQGRVNVVGRANAAAEAGRRVAEEVDRNNELARKKTEAAERARREAEPEARRERARTEALARIAAAEERAKRQAEEKARRDAEESARRVAEERKRKHPNSQDEPLLKKNRTGAPANVRNVLEGVGQNVALAKLHEPLRAPEPQNLGSFLSQSGALLSSLSSGWSSGWSRLTTKLLQEQNLNQPSTSIGTNPPLQLATPKATPQVTVDEELIYAFKNYSKPTNYEQFNLYYQACDFLRSSPQNFEAFKEDLEKDLKNIQNPREEGQVKRRESEILKRAQDVYNLRINSKGENEYEKSKFLKRQILENELNIQRQKKEEEARRKEKRKSKPLPRKWGQPPIQLPPEDERWSKNEIKSMQNSADYARLQVEAGTAFSKKGYPGRDEINWIGIFKGGPFTTRVYSSDNPPNHIGKKGIGSNLDPADTTFREKRRIENTNLGYLWSLQEKFDKDNNNFDISASVDPRNSREYIRKRVAEWKGESHQFKIKTTTNPSNLEEYCEYLMNNIEDLKAKETENSGEKIDKSKLKTLIAFQYLELGKIIYAGTWGNTIGGLNRAYDSSTQKTDIIEKILVTVPEQYQDYLKFNSGNVALEIHNSISLPRRNPLNSSKDIKKHRDYLESLANRERIKSTFVPQTYEGSDDWDVKHKEMLKRGKMVNNPSEYLQEKFDNLPNMGIMNTLGVAYAPLGIAVSNASAVGAFVLDRAGDLMDWTGQRADPATIGVSSQEINKYTGLGFGNPNAEARWHDKNLLDRRSADIDFQPNRDTRAEALARINEASKEERCRRQVNSDLRKMYSKTNGDFCIGEEGGNPFGRQPSMLERFNGLLGGDEKNGSRNGR